MYSYIRVCIYILLNAIRTDLLFPSREFLEDARKENRYWP